MKAKLGNRAKYILLNERKSRELLKNIIHAGKNDSQIIAEVVDDNKTYRFSEMTAR